MDMYVMDPKLCLYVWIHYCVDLMLILWARYVCVYVFLRNIFK